MVFEIGVVVLFLFLVFSVFPCVDIRKLMGYEAKLGIRFTREHCPCLSIFASDFPSRFV